MGTTDILFLIVIFLILALALLIWFLLKNHNERKFLKKSIKNYENKYRRIINVDLEIDKRTKEFSKTKAELQKEIDSIKESLGTLKDKYKSAKEIYEDLSNQNSILKDTLDIAEFGVYEPHFDLDTSEEFRESIKEIKGKQKDLIADETAVVCHTNWTVGNSQKKGETMTKRAIKLTLRAFNGECDSLIAKVRWNNVVQYEKRIQKTFEIINNLNKSNDIHIQPEYLSLKIDELRLTHEFEQKKHEEKEEQRRIREQMREEEKARRDFEKARAEAEKEEKMLQKAMKKAQEEIAKASEEEKERYEAQLQELQEQLKEAEDKNLRAISMAQQTKSGHVYVISNIGSFGENVFKIGMT